MSDLREQIIKFISSLPKHSGLIPQDIEYYKIVPEYTCIGFLTAFSNDVFKSMLEDRYKLELTKSQDETLLKLLTTARSRLNPFSY